MTDTRCQAANRLLEECDDDASAASGFNDLLEQIIADYQSYHCLALESVVIECLKRDRLSEVQADRVEAFFGDRAVAKEAARLRARRRLAEGGTLAVAQVRELLALEAFDVVEVALDRGAVGQDALDLFGLPEKGARNRKHWLRLYEKAQGLTRG